MVNKIRLWLSVNIQRIMAFFIKGLITFFIGGGFVFLGYYHHHYWQIVGIALLSIGGVIAGFAYILLLAYRLLNIANQPPH